MSKKIVLDVIIVDKIVYKYCNEMASVNEIKKEFGIGDKVLYRVLYENNIRPPKFSPMNPKYWVERGMSIENANIKVKSIRPSNLEYWEFLGYSKEDAKIKLDDVRMLTKNSFIRKYGEIDGNIKWNEKQKISSDNGKRRFTSCSQHWVDKGYSDPEIIKKKISESQRTFTLNKCVEKYGVNNGTAVWKERQDRWQSTLQNKENILEINKRKDCKSFVYYKRKFGEDWLEHLLVKRGYFKENAMYITNCLANATTYDQLIEYVSKNYEYIDQYNFQYRICRKILCDIFGVNLTKLKLDLLKKYSIDNCGVFGHKRELEGVIYSVSNSFIIF